MKTDSCDRLPNDRDFRRMWVSGRFSYKIVCFNSNRTGLQVFLIVFPVIKQNKVIFSQNFPACFSIVPTKGASNFFDWDFTTNNSTGQVWLTQKLCNLQYDRKAFDISNLNALYSVRSVDFQFHTVSRALNAVAFYLKVNAGSERQFQKAFLDRIIRVIRFCRPRGSALFPTWSFFICLLRDSIPRSLAWKSTHLNSTPLLRIYNEHNLIIFIQYIPWMFVSNYGHTSSTE